MTRPRVSRQARLGLAIVLAVCLGGCASSMSAGRAARPSSSPQRTPHAALTAEELTAQQLPPATGVHAIVAGSFPDPFVIERAPGEGGAALAVAGTNDSILSCRAEEELDCVATSTLRIRYSPVILARLHRAGLHITASYNHNITQAADGHWDMALTVEVKHGADGQPYSMILHASPDLDQPFLVPVRWTADAILVGSLSRPAAADYDGKYVSDAGRLYLIYSRQLSSRPPRDGLVAQRLTSPSRVAHSAPVTLLEPSNADGGLNSENYYGLHPTGDFKLVETGNIARIDGVFALVYSTGDYKRPDYKVGVAYSNTFLPAPGTTYRKVLIPDPTGIWGQPGRDEVDYLLQAQEPRWPHDIADSVLAPGVGTLTYRSGQWYLIFAGYSPLTQLTGPGQTFPPAQRRSYDVPVDVAIPQHASVAGTSGPALASWITPELGSAAAPTADGNDG